MRSNYNLLYLTVFLLSSISLFAQQRKISGTVTDSNGQPLPGVNIIIEGSNTGTQTDFDGNYSIAADVGDKLTYSFLGYATTQMVIGENTSDQINVTMKADSSELDEVVVTAFGIKRNPRDLGYSISSVNEEELTDNSEPDLITSLSGKVAGVNVNTSTGIAGAANRINIRGVTSISQSSQPLIIVDGVAYDNSQVTTSSQLTGGSSYQAGLSSLDPNNIESINVLKSTAAAALYGSRATNGVIVITTKTGASGPSKTAVSFSSGAYLENISNLPEYQNTYGAGVNFEYANANGSWGPRFSDLETIPTWPNLLDAFPELGETQSYVAQPNNVSSLFRTGVVAENSLSFSHSGDKGNFALTVSDLAQEGYIPFNTFDRTSVSAGGHFKLDNGITFGGNISYSESGQVGGFFGENQYSGASSSFARTLILARNWNMDLPYVDPETGASVIPNAGWDHPLWSWEHDQVLTDTYRTVANADVGYKFSKHISASLQTGINRYDLNRKQIRDLGSRASDGQGSITLDEFTNEDLESTLLINFDDYQFTDDIGFSAILGGNSFQNTQDRGIVYGTQFIAPGIYTIENNVNVSYEKDNNIVGHTRLRTLGVFADLTFSFKDYLFLNATGRNDWSSSLPKMNQSYFYPSLSASLIFTDAFGIKDSALTFGKLRGSYASVARSAPAEFLNRTYAVGDPYNGIPIIGNRINLADQELTPEFTTEYEAGIDLEFWKRRIALDFTYYNKSTTDLISPVSVPSSSGFQTFNTNIGKIENKGVEIGLTLVPVQTENFRWSLFTNFTKNENEVTELVEGVERIYLGGAIAYAAKGQPFGVFYGSKFARDDEGNYLINKSGGGIIADLENDYIGDPNPDFKASFINTLSYKGLSLKAQFDWREGGDISSTTIQGLLGRGVTKDTEDRERSFIIPGFYGDGDGNPVLDDQGNKIPNTTQLSMNELYFSPAGGNTFAINSVDEASIYDGTVYRLREVILSYEIPKKWLDKTPFGTVSISAVGNNLWYFAPNVPKYTNFDPEVTSFGSTNVQGIELQSAPTSKRYGARINLTF